MIVCDTGPLVALSNERDEHYFAANNLFRDVHMAGEQLVLPATVLAETCYWLNAHGGPAVEAALPLSCSRYVRWHAPSRRASVRRCSAMPDAYGSSPTPA